MHAESGMSCGAIVPNCHFLYTISPGFYHDCFGYETTKLDICSSINSEGLSKSVLHIRNRILTEINFIEEAWNELEIC